MKTSGHGAEPAGTDPAGTDPAGEGHAAITAVEELRFLARSLHRVDAAAAAAAWGDDSALAALAAGARAEAESMSESAGRDLAAAGASLPWLQRAEDHARGAELTRAAAHTAREAEANAVVAVALARAAVADAVVAVAQARQARDQPARRTRVTQRAAPLSELIRRVAGELRHVAVDRPRSILLRLVITLAISMSLVVFYHLSGLTTYDAGRLTLYLFSAVVGSVVCTNALCFEADRVRAALAGGERIWRILVVKNLAMAVLVTLAGLPVIAFLAVTAKANPIVLIDQLVTMVFIWLGVGNVLSVIYPLRHEPVSARLGDGTWKPYLLSFAVSYGVGLTVNLMIYWRLWARQAASAELAGGAWAAFALVLASAVTIWVLLTVFAVTCSREPWIRRMLSREMVVYRKAAKRSDGAGSDGHSVR